MLIEYTLYNDKLMDLRKIMVHLVVIWFNAITTFDNSYAFSFAILLQGICNIDGFWDFLKNKNIKKCLKVMLELIIVLSVLGIVLALTNLLYSNYLFENDKYELLIKGATLLIISFPIVVLSTDMQLNKQKENYVKEGDKDEL